MYVSHRNAAIVLTLILGVAACDSGTETEPIGIDPAEVTSTVTALVTPITESRSATLALQDAFIALTDQGVSFMRQASGAEQPALLRVLGAPAPAGDFVFPAELVGSTFVYSLQSGDWVVDSTRTGAPAAGVRVIWYDTDAAGNLLQPLSEEGYIDLTDEDTGGELSRIGIRMVETVDTGDVTLSELTESIQGTEAPQWSERFEAAGFYGGASRVVDFSAVSDAAGDSVSGDQDLSLSVALESNNETYALTINSSEDGATGDVQQNIVGTVTREGGVTELDLDLTQSGGAQSGSGILSHDGTPLVEVTVEGSDFRYQGVDGELSSRDEAGVDSLVRTLFLAGLEVLLSLPLILL